MAFIYKRKNKKSTTYYVQWYYRGKLYREKAGHAKETAQLRLAEIVRELETGRFSIHSDEPISKLIAHYRESLKSQPYSESYHRRLGNMFNNIEGYFVKKRVERVNQVDYPLLDDYITQRVNQAGIAAKTANMEIDLLKRLFEFSVKHKYIRTSPAEEIVRRKITRKEPRYFSDEEIELLIDKAGKYEAFFMVLLHTGLRASDAGNLRWSDIDLKKGFIRIVTEKTGQGQTIPINDTLRNYLLDYGTESARLFPELTTDKKRQKVRMYIQKVLREAGYEWKRIGCHTFRHTFASHLVINGASIYDVQKLLGHKSVSMTQMYAHLSEDATRRAVDLIDFNPQSVTNAKLNSVINTQKKV